MILAQASDRIRKLETKMVRIEVLIWIILAKLGVELVPIVSAIT